MSYYTAKYLREMLEDIPDDEPVAGYLMLRTEQEVYPNPDEDGRAPTPEEWIEIEALWVEFMDPIGFNLMQEAMRDAGTEIVPPNEESEVIASD